MEIDYDFAFSVLVGLNMNSLPLVLLFRLSIDFEVSNLDAVYVYDGSTLIPVTVDTEITVKYEKRATD